MEITKNRVLSFILFYAVVFPQVANAAYLGCYKENLRKRVYNRNPGALRSVTVTQERCMTICGHKYTYAALTKGYMCMCGTVAPTGLTLEPTKCTTPCYGNSNQTCGSLTHIDLFDAIKPVTSSLSVSKKIVSIGEAVTFTPNVVTSGSGWQMRMNYDDGAGYSTYVPSPASSLLSRSFYMAGDYSIGAFLTDPDKKLPDAVSKIHVHVDTPVYGVTVNCPSDMATYEPDVCTVDVMAGTGMQIAITYNDGGPPGTTVSRTFTIGNALEFSLGNPVQENIVDTPSSLLSLTSNNGLVLHPGNFGKKAGTLLGFEYFAGNTGTLNIFVFRPSTGCAGEYCPETNACEALGACGVSACTADEYCPDIMSCCLASPVVASSTLFASYTKVYTKSVTISSTGYGYVDVKGDNFALGEGDILAHSATGGSMLAQFPPIGGEEARADYYCSGIDGMAVSSITSGSCILQTELHQLRAVAAVKSSVYFPLEYTSPGTSNFQATVSNRRISGSETNSASIVVVDGVDQAILVVPACIPANENYPFTLETFTGNPVNIDWNFGDGNTAVETGVSSTSQTHMYTTTGWYDVTVNISNVKSFKNNQTQVCVQERITGFGISLPSSVEAGISTGLQLGMTSGSNYTCTFSFNSDIETTDDISTPPNANYMYIFSTPGDYSVSVICSNGIAGSTVTDSLLTRAVERIQGLALDPPGAVAGQSYRIKIVWTSGTDLTLTLTLNGNAVKIMEIDEVGKMAISEVLTAPSSGLSSVPVTVTVSNVISTEVLNINFAYEIPITNPSITCNFLGEITTSLPSPNVVIPTNSDVECSVTMDFGTSVTLTIIWGDASAPYTHSVASGDPWSSNPAPVPVTHSFIIPEICYMSVVVANGFNSHQVDYIVHVMTSVDNVEINGVAPVEFTPPASVTFTFSITSGPVPNGVTCVMSWGDLHTDTYEDYDLTQPITHVYRDMPGELTLQYTVSNIVSSKTGTTPVSIVTPIRDMQVYTNPSAAVVNVAVDLVFKARRAPGAGILNLTFICDVSVGTAIGPRKRTFNSPDGEDTEACIYTTTGVYTAKIIAQSFFETVEKTYNVIVQNPVTQEFTVGTNAPMDYPVTNCAMMYVMTFTGATLPDSASVEFDYGDGTTSGILSFSSPLSHSYQYAAPGHYTTMLRFFNLASEVTRLVPSGCYEDFSGVSMTVLRDVKVPTNSLDLPGFGPTADIFRIDEDMKLHVSMTTGTFVYHEVTAVSTTDIITCNSTNKDVATLTINVPGTYTITLIARNVLYESLPQVFVATLMEPAANISISDNGIVTKAYEYKTFTLTFDAMGTGMCLAVDNGADPQLYLYGDEIACQTDADKWSNGAFISIPVTNPLVLSYQYTTESTYHMIVTAYNEFWTSSKDFHFAVTSIDCSSPNIDVRYRHRYFNYPFSVKRKNRNRAVGITDLSCPETLNNKKVWTCEKWDPINDVSLGSVDLTSLPSSIKSELSIPALFLPYGLYRLDYKVTMLSDVDGEGFFGQAETFISVEPSDLVVQVFEGGVTLKTVGPAVDFTLSPRDFSYDPDDPSSPFDGYTLKCRSLTTNESYPVPDQYFTVEDLSAVPNDNGGCFRKGPGSVQSFSGSLTFNTNLMKVGNKYEIVVHGYKDTRESSAIAYLEVLAADPPAMTIAFKIPDICKPAPEGKLFNPNTQLGLLASPKCLKCPYTYLWEVMAYDYEYADLTDGWRLLSYLPDFIEGIESDELTIHTKLFSHYSTVETLQVRLHVTDTTTGITSKTYQNLVRNHPPTCGNCTINPSNGTAGLTNHTIICTGCTDENNEIDDYRVFCDTSEDSFIVASGSEPYWEDRQLPVGLEEDGFLLRCYVTVTDDLGSAATYFIQEATSTLMSRQQLKDAFSWMSDDQSDKSELLKATANLDQVAGFSNSLGTLFRVTSKDGEMEEYLDVGVPLHNEATTFGNLTPRPGAFQTPDTSQSDLLEQFEKERDNIVKVVNTVSGAFKACTIASPKDMQVAANAISSIVTSPNYIGRDAQEGFSDILMDMCDKLDNSWEELTVEDFTSIGKGIVSALGKIDEATELTKENPPNTDLEKEAISVRNFDSNLGSPLDDVGDFKNDKDALRDGKKIYNKRTQQAFANKEASKRYLILDKMSRVISKVKPKSPEPFVINTGGMELKVMKNSAKDIINKKVTTSGGSVALPSLKDLFPNEDTDDMENETMIFEAVAKVKPLSPEGSGGLVNQYSNSLTLSFRDKDGNKKKVENLATPIPISIEQDKSKPADILKTEYANPEIVATRPDEYLFFHAINKPQEPEVASIHLTFRPTNVTGNQLLVLISFAELPDIEKHNIEATCLIPSHTNYAGFYGDDTTPDPYTCFVDADIINGRYGSWKIGVKQLEPIDFNVYTSNDTLPLTVPKAWKDNKIFTQNYIMNSFIASCAYTDDDKAEWRSHGVKPGPLTTSDRIQCLAYHFTTFAGGWVVAPNAIDWNFVFSNADFFKNPTLYITEIVIAVTYILAMIWARRQDKQDVEKLGLAPLPDNDPRDKYYYEIFVSTGMRRNAGTESKVHFILSGEEEETDVRTFADSKRKIFQRGNLDGFLMAVPCDLGHLMYLRIWHDNSGKSKAASWYLNHIVIRDIQTDKKYYFISDRWFAVEEDDGQVDRVIPVAGKEQMSEFGHLFKERASKNLTDGHLWFSVVARPPQSRFTRCQRVSCCLCLLFMTMLANAMFYQTASSSTNAYTFGPFALTPEQIFIGVASNIIIFPINFLIITLFRKSRPRKLRPSRIEEALKAKSDRTTSVTDVNPKMKSSLSADRPGSSFLMEPIRSESSLSRPETSMSSALPPRVEVKPHSKKKKCELPWWFRIIAWILLWIAVLVSAAFVTFYGIMFQDIKCKKWITSMLISFFTSVFLTQPIKVFLFAIIFSLIIKNPGGDEDEDDDEEECKIAAKQDELLHQPDEGFSFISPQRAMYKPKPPDAKSLEAARQQRLKEIQMWSVIREIVFYAFFLWILMVISYKSISTESYQYKFSMEQVFILTNDTKHAFTKVKNTEDFWVWARSGMLRGLRAGPYYNNFPPFYMRGYINDKVSRLMGYATLRQVRVKPNTCKLPGEIEGVIPECNDYYEFDFEERGTYAAGWQPLTNPNDTREEYMFMTGESLNGYPYWGHMGVYGGGGYVVRLNGAYEDMIAHFVRLEQENWIDKYTRAVFLEFTVYNPSINLFSISTLLSEFQPGGGVLPTYRFEPCMLLPYMSSVLLFQIACEIIYFLFTIFFILKEIRNLYKDKWKYFLGFWNLVELCIIAMSITAIVIYFYRLYSVNELTEYFKETHGNEYMKFQYVGYWTEIFNYIIGFLVFFASMKFLKLLRFNKRISLLSDTLKNSGRALIHFSVIFNIVFLAFIQMFYLVYVANLDRFRTFILSCEAGIVMMMGKFDIYNMLAVNQWFTQIFIFLFVVSITFIIVNMFLSILNETFANVRSDLTKQQNDYEIVDFMMGRFKMWTGLGRPPPTNINPAEIENERNRSYRTLEGQIDYFPSQIDRFLSSISNMYMERNQFDDFLRKGAYGKMMMKSQMADTRHPQPGPSGLSRPRKGSRPKSGREMTDVQT